MTMASSPLAVDLARPGVDVAPARGDAPARSGPCGGPARRSSPRPRLTTSMPCRVSSRIAASLISGARTCWAQPGRSATRLRRSPAAGNACGRSTGDAGGQVAGASFEHRARGGASRASRRSARASGLASRASTMAARNARRPRQQPGEHARARSGRAAGAGRSSRCGRGRDRPDACSSRPTDRWSCRTGTTGSGRCA